MSKGSTPRPFSVSQAEYENRWDAIFQRDLPVAEESSVSRSLIKGIMSTPNCGHPFCQCVDVCGEAK